MAEKKKNRFGGQATTDAEIRQRSEQAYASSGQAAANRQQGIQTGQRVQQSRAEKTGSAAPSASSTNRRRFSGVELLQKASNALKGLTQDRSDSINPKMPDMRPIGSVIADAKPGEAATRAGEVMPSALKNSLSGVANTLGFLLDPSENSGGVAMRDPSGSRKELGDGKITSSVNELRGMLSDRLYDTAKNLSDEAAAHEKAAKEGLGKVGRTLVDVGIAGVQMAGDSTIGMMTGTGMLPIGTRVFGQAAREGLDAGASRQAAAAYAASSAAVEMLTEKMFDVGKIFGKGAGDELIEKAVEKWAKTPAGTRALRTFFGVLTESGEEAASDLVNPMVRLFIDSDAVKETYGTAEGRRQLRSDIGHDALIGGILGGGGTVVNGNRAAEQQQRLREAAAEAERAEQRQRAAETQRTFFAGNTMQTGTADAEAAAELERNRARANRPQTAQALSRVFGGQQITEAEANSILSDTELMEQMLRATGTPVIDGDVRSSFIHMMEQNGTPLFQTPGNAAESPTFDAAAQEGNLTGAGETAPSGTGIGQNSGQSNGGSAETHIDNRGADEISSTKVKAFQFEHPELREHFVNIAQQLQQDAAESVSNGPMALRKGGTRIQKSKGLAALMERTHLSRNKLVTVLQNIIDDHGAENNADAKRVELALDYLMSQHPDYRDDAYREKKGQLDGGTPVGSLEEYIKQNELSIELGEVTEDEVRREWEQMQAERNAAAEAAPAQAESPAQSGNGLPEGHGAMSAQFPYQEAPSQTHSADSIFTEEERQNVEGLRPEDLTHQVRTNADVDFHAQERLESDYEGEKADLFRDESEWDVVDIATAWQILAQETRIARETGDWSEVVRLRRVYRDKASNWGQVGHEMSRHANTAEDIISDAAETLTDAGNMAPDEIRDTMDQITDLATEWQNMQQGQNEELLALIRTLNAARRTGGLFTPERTGNTLNRTLEAVLQQEGGYDYLWQVAGQQIRSLASDRVPMSPIEAAKSIRYLSMLSKLNTVMRNLLGNNVFDPIESVSGNVATIPDMLMSLVTHRRTTAADASWFSEAKRRGSWEAMQRAYIAAALDVDTNGETNRWEQRNGRTFKMASNPFARFLSTVEKWQNYALTVTDEFQKGGIEAEAERQRQRLIDRGQLGADELQGWAEETARQRTFQNDGTVSNLMLGARNLLNGGEQQRLTLHDNRGGTFGVGDALIPFARVPGNVVGQFLNYSPAGAIHGLTEMVNVLRAARNGTVTAEQQAQAARDIGRGLNGSALLAGFAYLAAQGLLNVADGGDTDDEKDLAKLQQSEGVTGTQWNLSATLRALQGGGAEWQDGDDLLSIGFLEPINGIMALAALVADSDELNARTLANSTAAAAMQSIADLPAMSSLTNIINNYKYAEGEAADKLGMVGAQLVGDTISSFVPNALAGIAQGADNGTVRQTYGSDREGLAGVAEETLSSIRGKIPGMRSQLPAALDNLGQERRTTASPLQNWLNSNILPGAVTQYSTNRVNQEIERMATEGAKVPDRSAEKSFTQDGQTYELNNAQKRTYQKAYGKTARDGVQVLLNSEIYRGMSKAEKSAAMDAVLDFARQTARESVFPSYEVDGKTAKARQAAEEAEISPVEYLLIASTYMNYDEDGNGSLKQSEVTAALDDSDLDDWQKAALWQLYNSNWSSKNNPYLN